MIRQFRKSLGMALLIVRHSMNGKITHPAAWLQTTADCFSRLFGLKIRVFGDLPASGLIVANHLGYLDILALASVLPCCFVAKSDVAHWPVFGSLARRGGTLFIDRTQRKDVAKANLEISHALLQPLCTVVFPEGTSTDGQTILPFYSSLLEPARVTGCPVTPLRIVYRMPDSDPATRMAYHGAMTILPHIWELFRYETLHVDLIFGNSQCLSNSRKKEATRLRNEIFQLQAPQNPAV